MLSGMLQFVILFLTVEAVFYPQLLDGQSCSTHDQGFVDISQSYMNTWLSAMLVFLITLTNEWKAVLQPIVTRVKNHAQGDVEEATFRALSSTSAMLHLTLVVMLLMIAIWVGLPNLKNCSPMMSFNGCQTLTQ